jgi:hypothetical protein
MFDCLFPYEKMKAIQYAFFCCWILVCVFSRERGVVGVLCSGIFSLVDKDNDERDGEVAGDDSIDNVSVKEAAAAACTGEGGGGGGGEDNESVGEEGEGEKVWFSCEEGIFFLLTVVRDE